MLYFKGVFTALVTPFRDNKIDFEAYYKLLRSMETIFLDIPKYI